MPRAKVVPQDYVEAAKWYRARGPDQGDSDAQYPSRVMYMMGPKASPLTMSVRTCGSTCR